MNLHLFNMDDCRGQLISLSDQNLALELRLVKPTMVIFENVDSLVSSFHRGDLKIVVLL